MYYFIEAAAGGSYEPGLDTRPVEYLCSFSKSTWRTCVVVKRWYSGYRCTYLLICVRHEISCTLFIVRRWAPKWKLLQNSNFHCKTSDVTCSKIKAQWSFYLSTLIEPGSLAVCVQGAWAGQRARIPKTCLNTTEPGALQQCVQSSAHSWVRALYSVWRLWPDESASQFLAFIIKEPHLAKNKNLCVSLTSV